MNPKGVKVLKAVALRVLEQGVGALVALAASPELANVVGTEKAVILGPVLGALFAGLLALVRKEEAAVNAAADAPTPPAA